LRQGYLYTTNPDIATGDGVAMAYRAGARWRTWNLSSFIRRACIIPRRSRFSSAKPCAGRAGVLKSLDDVEFMDAWHPLKSLAPRDVVARAIDSEMKKAARSTSARHHPQTGALHH